MRTPARGHAHRLTRLCLLRLSDSLQPSSRGRRSRPLAPSRRRQHPRHPRLSRSSRRGQEPRHARLARPSRGDRFEGNGEAATICLGRHRRFSRARSSVYLSHQDRVSEQARPAEGRESERCGLATDARGVTDLADFGQTGSRPGSAEGQGARAQMCWIAAGAKRDDVG
jgi:hypothetical protein